MKKNTDKVDTTQASVQFIEFSEEYREDLSLKADEYVEEAKVTQRAFEMLTGEDNPYVIKPYFARNATEAKRLEKRPTPTTLQTRTRLNTKIPEDSRETIEVLQNTPFQADVDQIDYILNNEEIVKRAMGYLDIPYEDDDLKDPKFNSFWKLSKAKREGQEGKNRSIEKSIDTLRNLRDELGSDLKDTKMYFDYSSPSNNRYHMISNTINPQTDKKLHRWLIQPSGQLSEYTYDKSKMKFKTGNKDVSDVVYFAIAQGLGQSADKMNAKDITKFSKKVIKSLNTAEKIEEARKSFIENGEFKLKDGTVLEIEEVGHGLKIFGFLDALVKSGNTNKFNYALPVEFDAITSGFILRLLMLPVVDMKKMASWFQRVGVFNKKYKYKRPSDMGKIPDTMGDLLATPGFFDSYEELGRNVKRTTFDDIDISKIIDKNKFPIVDEGDAELWDTAIQSLPDKVFEDGTAVISSAIRKLMKPVFMTYNYGAMRGSVKRKVGNVLYEGLVDNIAAIDLESMETKKKTYKAKTDEDKATLKLMKIIQREFAYNNLTEVREAARTGGFDARYNKDGTKTIEGMPNVEEKLKALLEATYGEDSVKALDLAFPELSETTPIINEGFNELFRIFEIELNKELEELRSEKGEVTRGEYDEILERLSVKYLEVDGAYGQGGVVIVSEGTGEPGDSQLGVSRSTIFFDEPIEISEGKGKQTSLTTSLNTRVIGESFSGGSVVPVHVGDSALLGNTIKTKGVGSILGIHDAIIPEVGHAVDAVKAYNKETMMVGIQYNFAENLMKKMVEVSKESEEFNDKSLSSITDIVLEINKGKIEFIDAMLNGDLVTMNMASVKGSSFDSKDLSETERKTLEDTKTRLEKTNTDINEYKEKSSKLKEELLNEARENEFKSPVRIYSDYMGVDIDTIGDFSLLDPTNNKIAVVGPRKPSERGKKLAEDNARRIAKQGSILVSGNASGIDTIAQETALKNGGKVITILPQGLSTAKDFINKESTQKYIKNGQLVIVSGFGENMAWSSRNAMKRNQHVRDVSNAVIVAEGGLTGGTAEMLNNTPKEKLFVRNNADKSDSNAGVVEAVKAGKANIIKNTKDFDSIFNMVDKKLAVKKTPTKKAKTKKSVNKKSTAKKNSY